MSDYWIAESSFLRRLKVLSPIKNQAIYGGLGFQAAGLYEPARRRRSDDDEVIYGGYLFLAGPTALGTFTLGVGLHRSEWQRVALDRQADLDRDDPRRRPVPLAGNQAGAQSKESK